MLRRHPLRLIWLLAASLLLMQSVAIWHDAEHPFHDHVAQCDPLNLISQQTPLASQQTLSPAHGPLSHYQQRWPAQRHVVNHSSRTASIRAPPFSS